MKLNDIENCKKLITFLEDNEIMSDNSPTSSCAAILYYHLLIFSFQMHFYIKL